MSESDTAAVTIRWFLLSLATAATVAIFYMVASSAGWSFGTASAYLIAASTFGCLALSLAWFIRSHYSSPTGGIEARLDRIATPTGTPNTDNPSDQTEIDEAPGSAGQSPESTPAGSAEVAPDQPQAPPGDVSTSGAEPQPAATEGSPPPGEVIEPLGVLGEDRLDAPGEEQSVEAPPVRLVGIDAAHPRRKPASSAVAGPTVTAPDGDAAKHLADLLNQYEQTGFPTAEPPDSRALEPSGAGHTSRDGELWSRLVEQYGAESIDLRNIRSGVCRIMLTSGDLVFYSPERQCWMWIIFEQGASAPLSGTHPPPLGHVADTSR